MNIIFHKDNKYNNDDFFEKSYLETNISGIMLDIIMTKDKKIIVFTPPSSQTAEIFTIQDNDFTQIKNSNIKSLDNYLEELINFPKLILINILELQPPLLNENTSEMIIKRNNEYINEILKVIDNYSEITINLTSSNQIILNLLKNRNLKYKLGWLLVDTSSNYIDLDIYIFQTFMLDQAILTQQLDYKKEIMSYIKEGDSINHFINFFNDIENNPMKKRIFDSISIITNYPDIFINIYK